MPDFYDVAMFSAALEKKPHLLPNGTRKSASKKEPTYKAARSSEETLVEANSTSPLQKEESQGSDKL
ncbi:hypothetical protein N8I77_012066 [Diaporthe amygdali]|uniref:Uncharacterized protein n=1 Tax=Phomopsis amygdali TaxID=1214568 RepID=A0AAD9S5E0_PHOAM|nr:hypothetical protein N8I77_012066 [Diaporthe amygdali]